MDAHHTQLTTPCVITASKTKAGGQDQTGRLRLKRAPAHRIMEAGARRRGASSLCSRLDDQAFDGSDLSSSEEYARGDALSSGDDDTDEDYDEGEAKNEKRRKDNRREIKASESEGEGPESENGEFSSDEDRNCLAHFELKAEELGAGEYQASWAFAHSGPWHLRLEIGAAEDMDIALIGLLVQD